MKQNIIFEGDVEKGVDTASDFDQHKFQELKAAEEIWTSTFQVLEAAKDALASVSSE